METFGFESTIFLLVPIAKELCAKPWLSPSLAFEKKTCGDFWEQADGGPYIIMY